MGIIKEPKGIDFIIQSPPPTEEELKEISEFIKMRKNQRKAESTKKNSKVKTRKDKVKA